MAGREISEEIRQITDWRTPGSVVRAAGSSLSLSSSSRQLVQGFLDMLPSLQTLKQTFQNVNGAQGERQKGELSGIGLNWSFSPAASAIYNVEPCVYHFRQLQLENDVVRQRFLQVGVLMLVKTVYFLVRSLRELTVD